MNGQTLIGEWVAQPSSPDLLQRAIPLEVGLRNRDSAEQLAVGRGDGDRDGFGGDAPLHHLDTGQRFDEFGEHRRNFITASQPPALRSVSAARMLP